jgi:hypothetical protein
VSIQAQGHLKDSFYFELSSDEQADLPFDRINSQRVSCTFKDTAHTVLAKQGRFLRKNGSSLRVMPDAGCIVLDFSAR